MHLPLHQLLLLLLFGSIAVWLLNVSLKWSVYLYLAEQMILLVHHMLVFMLKAQFFVLAMKITLFGPFLPLE